MPSGTLTIVASSTILLGYGFLIDMSTKAWWNAQQIWWQHLDYLSITPMRHSVRFDELTEVVSADHPANLARGKPFDRFLLISPADTVTILPSFHRRAELEELLSLIYEKRPEVFTDERVTNFINGDYSDWWR